MGNDKQQEDDGWPARGAGTAAELSALGQSIPGTWRALRSLPPCHPLSHRGDKWPGMNPTLCVPGTGSGKCRESTGAGSGMAEHVAQPRGAEAARGQGGAASTGWHKEGAQMSQGGESAAS